MKESSPTRRRTYITQNKYQINDWTAFFVVKPIQFPFQLAFLTIKNGNKLKQTNTLLLVSLT
jgi:hypothetical protein